MHFKIQLFTLILLLFSNSALAQQGGLIIEQPVYSFPSWDIATETTDVEKWYAIRNEYVAAVKDRNYVFEKIRYSSDNREVVAYLYGPKKKSRTKRPIIVFNRGGYIKRDIAPELLPRFHRLAKSGFTIVAPMYRGSDGAKGHDEMGGADLEPMIETDRGKAMARSIWPDFDEQRTKIVTRRSAIQWPEKINVPLLLMHGADDGTVPPTQTLPLASGLTKAQKEYGVIVFPGGKHVLKAHRFERDQKAVEFFKMYMVE